MSDETRKALLDEANELGLDFHSNIPTPKLQTMVDEAKGLPPAVEETAPASPAAKPELDTGDDDDDKLEVEATPEVQIKNIRKKAALSKFALKRQKIAESKTKAMKTQIVTLTNKDNRENDVMTTAYLSFENQYFGLSRIVPLDIPVQLEIALIKIAERSTMTLHKDEIIDGKRTGNKVPMRVKKFAISYGRPVE